MSNSLSAYFRCPDEFIRFRIADPLPEKNGYFRFGENSICFGGCEGEQPSKEASGPLRDVSREMKIEDGVICLPFDPQQVARNLHCELYVSDWRSGPLRSAITRIYYFVRPILPVTVRRHMQKLHLKVRPDMPFPRWPVDTTIDNLFGQLLLLALRSSSAKRIPFIWFWPGVAPSGLIVTHDVETTLGRDFCATLMDIDDSFGIKASFQVIPEQRYIVTPEFLDSIRSRGFEVAVHDLNHDGHLYRDRGEFMRRAAKINAYAKEYGADGFRAGALYRKQMWYEALDFAYDMSIPNVATFDPQRGGCCTVMPYFLDHILELPVTMTQDYTLFNILEDHSIDLWKNQIDLILSKNGLISCVIHPDYIMESTERKVYEELLAYLVQLNRDNGIWLATPGQVNQWWRQRAEMRLVENNGSWVVEGPGQERARVAFATETDGRLTYSFQED